MSAKVENWHKLNARLVWAYEGPVQARFRIGSFRQGAVAAWLILKGSLRLRFQASAEEYRAGKWVFPKGEEWQQEFSPDAEIVSVRFMAHWPDGTPLFDRGRTLAVAAAEAPRLAAIARRMVRYIRKHGMQIESVLEQIPWTLDDYLSLQRLFQDWLRAYVELMRARDVRMQTHEPLDERVWAAVSRMESRGLNETFREADLARLTGVSKSHLNRLFVAGTGKTPADYWDDRRVKAAHDALLNSRRSVKTIAYELGFGSLSHFSTWVRKKTGKSPRALRAERS